MTVWKIGDKAKTPSGDVEIVKISRQPAGAIHGRYAVKHEDGTVVENFPGYLLAADVQPQEAPWPFPDANT